MKLFVLLFLFCVFIILQEYAFSKLWHKKLTLSLTFKDHELQVGSQTCLVETIENAKALPLPILHVKLMMPRSFHFPFSQNANITDYYYRNDIFSVGRQEKLVRKLYFTCNQRGYYKINNLQYGSRDYFLTASYFMTREIFDYIYVTPKKIAPQDFPTQFVGLNGSIISDKALFEDPFEFKGIRQYQPYDSYRAINWKASARQQNIQVNTFFSTFNREVFFVLNLTPRTLAEDTYILEESISILSSLATQYLHKKIPVGFTTNALDIESRRPISIRSGVGIQHERNIDLKLARIDLNQTCDEIRNCLHFIPEQNYTQIIYISPSSMEESKETFIALKNISNNAIWIHPYILNPLVLTGNVSIEETQIMNWEVNKRETENDNITANRASA